MNESQNNDDTFDENYEMAFNILKAEIKKQCPESDTIIRYSEKEISGKARIVLVEHLEMCPICSEIVQKLQKAESDLIDKTALPNNWNVIEHEMNERVYRHLDTFKEPKAVTKAKSESLHTKITVALEQWFNRYFRPLNFAYVGLLISCGLGGLYTYALLSRPTYFSITQIQPYQPGTLRGESIEPESLRMGLKYFEQSNYEMAITSFSEYLKSHPSDYFANFHLGLVYLHDGKESLLGLPYRYNSSHIQKGILYLNSALVNTRNNAYYQEDCLWFLGKAYIMLGEMPKAKQQFEKLISMNQSNLMRKATAKEMIKMIDEYISK